MDSMLGAVFGAGVLLVLGSVWQMNKPKSSTAKYPDPPIIPFSRDEIFRNPHECFEYGFRHYGHVFRYRGNGRIQYMVSKELTERVLTEDATFSFELGLAQALKLSIVYALHGGTFYSDVDAIVTEVAVKRLKTIIPKISPVFQRNAAELIRIHGDQPFDPLPYLQKTVAEAIAIIIFGNEIAQACNPDLIIDIAEGVAKATGMFQNQSSWGKRFPTLYSICSWVELILFHLIWRFGRHIGWTVWTALSELSKSPEGGKGTDEADSTVLVILARKLATRPGHLSISSKLWAVVLSLAFIFASVHQTVVIMTYVVFELARHPECQELILTDLSRSTTPSPDSTSTSLLLTSESLRDATHAESFTREVLRMKGEAITTARSPRSDMELGGYFIPRGRKPAIHILSRRGSLHGRPAKYKSNQIGCLLHPMVYTSNRSSEHATNPHTFDGMRWVQSRKLATTTGPGHLSFGLGRWACPGRFLAVSGEFLSFSSTC
ncbi:cytochrome P450 [Aspergillus steynii IBT 23096]|uniref:Cytochrome P450 n=1 Tax=Aspergillus steynii IBT 23096 TaxID=1392250 RepID=A0A2I2GJH0_9EURO|nr:cytochrome P450 [Aspergillus steynii IBT 23096]PLB53031.1 cytochrome P450 [Aspergillus steynii IBT 23096]